MADALRLAGETREVVGTSRPELNGKLVKILGELSDGRIRVKLAGRELSLRPENLRMPGWRATIASMASQMDLNEVRNNARFLWGKPAFRIVLGVLAFAVLTSRGRVTTSAPHRSPPRRAASPAYDAAAAECYALGYADASKGRTFGASLGADEAEHADLVSETLADLPPEAQGLRDEWARK
eukprot:CAMPEP_0119292336 /NCGR_PEP_ID=MMETSP1329-20130426/43970_1 /TAXON_ID=114041 /ORGANISM="Genus nov. species nov., Strain RCC1024" /LENGTH=181 /DNA_ID=CAMNT_0007293173 /DNA_START=213 /DNA_END=755 /DNA_ORIENTATION=+